MSNETPNNYEPEKLADGTKVYRVPGPKSRGPKLRALRDRSDVNLRELAEVCEIDHSLISRYESGERPLSVDTYTRLVDGIETARRKKEQEKELEARTQALVDELYPILEAAEAQGSPLKRSELPEALWMSRLLQVAGMKPSTPPRGELAKALLGVDPFYQTIASSIVKRREREAEMPRQLAALENLQSIDDPIISELIESFRREIAEKDVLLQELGRALEEK